MATKRTLRARKRKNVIRGLVRQGYRLNPKTTSLQTTTEIAREKVDIPAPRGTRKLRTQKAAIGMGRGRW